MEKQDCDAPPDPHFKSSRCHVEKDSEGQERTQESGLGMISKVVRVTVKLFFFFLWLCLVFVTAHGLSSLAICVILIS